MTKLRLSLDWTPNINHIGFFVARENGYYRDEDISLEIIDPSYDNYLVTPAKKVEMGQADIAICPTESVVSYRTKSNPFDLIGIATVFQKDLSAIAVKSNVGINRPKDLEGRTYASYQARYEDGIVKKMIENDGGKGNILIEYPHKLGIWETLVSRAYDATWIFLNWEGIEAKENGTILNYFKMENFGIPYSYSPLVVARENTVNHNREMYRRFLAATRKGHEYCIQHPNDSTEIFKSFVPRKDQNIDLSEALDMSIKAFGSEWGRIEAAKVGSFLSWLHDNGLEKQQLSVSEIVDDSLF